MKNEIKLTHALKIALLEAIQRGSLDLSIFGRKTEKEPTQEEITAEIIRLEKFFKPEIHAALMADWANGKLTDEEYLQERLKHEI